MSKTAFSLVLEVVLISVTMRGSRTFAPRASRHGCTVTGGLVAVTT
ncbi:MAG TPA: hypothetical protein VL131_12235 [Gammaproteobacteria bacterium]|nr:hypothetical protein [Gammaproteobacteria bacterium]